MTQRPGSTSFLVCSGRNRGNLKGLRLTWTMGTLTVCQRFRLHESPVPADVILTLEQLDTTPITAAMVWEWTRKDPVLDVLRLLFCDFWRKAGQTP